MKNTIEISDLSKAFRKVAETMDENSEKLCEMDAMMGDGDLGQTMKKGFAAFSQAFDEQEDVPQVGKRIVKAAMKMSSAVPSTMGTLMSSALMSGGMKIANNETLDAASFKSFIDGLVEGIIKRGKCERGDRTVLDALGAAADSVSEALTANAAANLEEVFASAIKGVRQGAEDTKAMQPKFGKALVHRDKAEGVIDQGAYCGMLLIEALCDPNNY
ncbi:MAG: dihydroxyacetone kinase subunit L [Erysipelotrichaceae bacterium]|nr:dihydroxyacetone kinase subunit L [Erysipelotrichaceae bacterium]